MEVYQKEWGIITATFKTELLSTAISWGWGWGSGGVKPSVALGLLSTFGNLPREDSEAEEDLVTLNARSESLSSGLLL